MNFKAVKFPKINIVCMHKIYTVTMFFSPLLPKNICGVTTPILK